MDLLKSLKSIFGDRVYAGDLWREIYARDASYFNIRPQAIVRPRSVDEIGRLLSLATQTGVGVTFRCGGTSLSGQTVGEGIICELRTAWTDAEVRDEGRRVWFEPGLTAAQVNHLLHPHHHHIGPDPASSSAAMMGGILSNNSSGMQAGVKYNSYHTLASLQFMLANGHRYDSSQLADRKRFEETETDLCKGLMDIRSRILASPELTRKITEKYKIKNVTGYAMNSFVDFDNPMDIFIHALIGSEGTLAYIISGELNTLPLYDVYSSAQLYFPTVTDAAATAQYLGEQGALAVEMMDYASLVSYLGKNADLPQGTTVMLVDFGANSSAEMADMTAQLTEKFAKLPHLSKMDPFTHTVHERAKLWQIRDGIFPCVAGARVPGSTVILEDVAAPVGDLDRLVGGIQDLFKKYGYEGSIFGHARDGNIHPLLTSAMDNVKETDNFRRFMDGMVDHVLSLNGSLKGEHGTGRAIAPFVAREWGDEIYGMMKQLKKLADPAGILNPGVIINDDPDCFIQPIKHLPLFGRDLGYDKADKCMECGYCENVCPSRNVTLTPRQRLQALRVIKDHPDAEKLKKEYRYIGEETCCVDSTCQLPCPMGISTGEVTDLIRARTDPKLFEKILSGQADTYGAVISTIRGLLRAAVITEKVVSPYPLIWATDVMHKIYSQVPHFSKYFPYPSRIPWRDVEDPDFVYFPSCVTRIFGGSTLKKDDMITVMLRVADRAGLKMSMPREIHPLCCSQIWQHKGDPKAQALMADKVVEAFWKMSSEGRVPIVCDTTSCTHTLLRGIHNVLSPESLEHYKKLKIRDITQWLLHDVLPRLEVTNPKGRVLIHPTCASKLLDLAKEMVEIAHKCAREVDWPFNARCCGAAGDRGFIYPEVARTAVIAEKKEIGTTGYDGCYSLARTCEISMQSVIGRPYESIIYLVDETTSPKSPSKK